MDLKNFELVLTIFNSARVSVFGRENIPSQMCFEEKKCRLLGRTKNSGRVNDSPLGRENVRVGLFCYKSCVSLVFKKRRVLTVHGG